MQSALFFFSFFFWFHRPSSSSSSSPQKKTALNSMQIKSNSTLGIFFFLTFDSISILLQIQGNTKGVTEQKTDICKGRGGWGKGRMLFQQLVQHQSNNLICQTQRYMYSNKVNSTNMKKKKYYCKNYIRMYVDQFTSDPKDHLFSKVIKSRKSNFIIAVEDQICFFCLICAFLESSGSTTATNNKQQTTATTQRRILSNRAEQS